MFDEDIKSEFWQNPLLQRDYMGLWTGEKRDDAYLWEMYPKESKVLRSMAQEALDLQDYRGSFIYDEYPDKFLFMQMVNRITQKYMNNSAIQDPEMKKWIFDMTQVILANEIDRLRKKKRFW